MIEIPAAAPKQLRDLGAKRDRLKEAARQAASELNRLELQLETARAEDRAAYAERLSRDLAASNPGGKNVAKVQATIDEMRARKRALLEAVENAERDIAAALTENSPKWLSAAESEREKRRRAYGQAVEALAVAKAELDEREQLCRWLRSPGTALGKLRGPRLLTSLRKQNGSPHSFAGVLAALRADVEPEIHTMPQPEQPPEPGFVESVA
jgi:hypothetical protein